VPCSFTDLSDTNNFKAGWYAAKGIVYYSQQTTTSSKCANTHVLEHTIGHGHDRLQACMLEAIYDANNFGNCKATYLTVANATMNVYLSDDGTTCECATDACATTQGTTGTNHHIIADMNTYPTCVIFRGCSRDRPDQNDIFVGFVDYYTWTIDERSNTVQGYNTLYSGPDEDMHTCSASYSGQIVRHESLGMPPPATPAPPPAPPWTFYCRYDTNDVEDICCHPDGGHAFRAVCQRDVLMYPEYCNPAAGGDPTNPICLNLRQCSSTLSSYVTADCYYGTYTATCMTQTGCD